MKVIFGFILGIMVCNVGVSGSARIFDHGISKVQDVAKEAAK